VLNTLSGSFQISPMFFLKPKNGVNYNIVAQTPQYDIQSLQDLQNIPITAGTAAQAGDPGRCRHDQAASDGGRGHPLQHPPRDRHLRRVQDRDLGAVAADIAHRRRHARRSCRAAPSSPCAAR
jgi:hypothetical protein